MTHISDLLPEHWPTEVLEALNHWHQGHLLSRPPLFWAADPRHPLLPFTEANGDSARNWQIFTLPIANRPPYGLVISQTCDICEARPNNPFVDVAPVVDLSGVLNDGQKTEVRRHLWNDYVYLTRQPVKGRFYVADLRTILPVRRARWSHASLFRPSPVRPTGSTSPTVSPTNCVARHMLMRFPTW